MQKAIIVSIVVSLFAWLGYLATGRRVGGETTNVTGIPIVGDDLAELVLTSAAAYRGFEHPHGGGTFTIAGTATPESMAEFCSNTQVSKSMGGTSIQDRGAILGYLREHEVEIPDDDTLIEADVLFGMGGRFRKLYGVYDGPTQRFWITLQFDGSKWCE